MPVSSLIPLTGTTPTPVAVVKPLSRFKIKKIMAYNGDTADHTVKIGYSNVNPDGTIDTTSFTQILPDIVVTAGQTIVLDSLPEAHVSSTTDTIRAITAELDAAVATTGASVSIVVEWEEA